MSLLAVVSTLLLLAAGEAVPADDPMEELVITADRASQKSFSTARNVTVVKKKTLDETLATSVPDAMISQGYYVQKTFEGAGAPIVRGMIGLENLVLIDGVRFNTSIWRTGPVQYMSLLDTRALSRLEILHGPGSVLYGSDAMGGVIHAISADPQARDSFGWSSTFFGRGASADMGFGGGAELDAGSSGWGSRLGVNADRLGDLRDGSGTRQDLSSMDRLSFHTKNRLKLGGGWQLEGAAFGAVIDDAGRTDQLGKGNYTIYDNSDLLAWARLSERGAGLLKNLSLTVSYQYFSETSSIVDCAKDGGGLFLDLNACMADKYGAMAKKKIFEDGVHSPGLSAVSEFMTRDGRLQVVAGAEGYLDYVQSEGRSASSADWKWAAMDRGNFSDGSKFATAAGFARATLRLPLGGANRIAFSGGSRLTAAGAWAKDVPGVGDLDYGFYGWVSNLGVSWTSHDVFHLYFDWSQGFRAPNLQETTVLGDTGSTFEVPNGGLGPMRSDTVELGTKIDTPVLSLGAAGFLTWVSDMIDRETVDAADYAKYGIDAAEVAGQEVKRRVNYSSAEFKGFEVRASTKTFAGFSLTGSTAYVKGDVKNKDGEHPARRVPPVHGMAALRYEHSRFFGEFQFLWALTQDRLNPDDKKDLRICEDPANPGTLLTDCKGTEGYATIGLAGGFRPTDRLSVHLRLDNLLDAQYRIHGSGLNAPGFNAQLLAELKL